ncbi:RpoN DNA-directed RNA polymerase specialized sigma subunit, sigma54 homolog [Candidatus Methylopumilus universalis]|uniref:RNA polymerase factor sigma-54 n=1 Tax=Candidatus Methylopumilus TaxID=1679002 RepID=UPI00111FE9FC|nr:RNA polymerase factor sigma-54 [Candidatus Methylopumilus planktonicus]QDC99772.1 RNA polymerase factor sigma-54 [Candidatus Methylopumilus planktonicus]
MKQNLQFKASQHLSLTPQLQQSIKLLQMSSVELNQELEILIQQNPLIEMLEEDEEDVKDIAITPQEETSFEILNDQEIQDPIYEHEINWDEEYTKDNNYIDSNDYRESAAQTLKQYLEDIFHLIPIGEKDQAIISLLIDSINEDGYLEEPLDYFLSSIPKEYEVSIEEIESLLKLLQKQAPPGIGARDLIECLTLQLESKEESPIHILSIKVIKSHLNLLASRDFVKLKKILGCEDEVLREIQKVIKSLNPKPGNIFSTIESHHFIQHEVNVKKVKANWQVSLNEQAIPKLRLNHIYRDLIKNSQADSAHHLSSQIQEAKWIVKNIQQRFVTILKVSEAIMKHQKDFLDYGESMMKPLILREIAEEVGLHESTISRVTSNKYINTPRGIYELKFFFGSSIDNSSGNELASTAIRAKIKEVIKQEDPKKPLSDSEIVLLLKNQDINIARRTVAKYREILNIAPTNLRKIL